MTKQKTVIIDCNECNYFRVDILAGRTCRNHNNFFVTLDRESLLPEEFRRDTVVKYSDETKLVIIGCDRGEKKSKSPETSLDEAVQIVKESEF